MHIATLTKRPDRAWKILRYKGNFRAILQGEFVEFEHDIRESLDCGYTLSTRHPKRGWNGYRERQLKKLVKDIGTYTPHPIEYEDY